MEDCIFCKIIKGEIPSEKVYEDDLVYAFKDVNPAAPVHLLVVPKKHIPSLNEVAEEDKEVMGHIILVLKKLAQDFNVAESGYRVLNNCGDDGGQVVYHIHFHLLGGRKFKP